MKKLRIGTRGSALALWQANHVRERLLQLHGLEAELVRIRTSGDNFQMSSIPAMNAQSGGKGVFIKEIEDALLEGKIDLAVHSMKDVPTETPEGLALSAITRREDARDCLISAGGRQLSELRDGARVGTSSLRRQAQLRHYRQDLDVRDLRGNVDTRLAKLGAGEYDAIVLAAAGVRRLGLADRITQLLSVDMMMPAVGQGALAIETQADDRETRNLAQALDDSETRAAVMAERALLRELEGGCQIPLGAFASVEDGRLELQACVFSTDGAKFFRRSACGSPLDPESLGKSLGRILMEAGAARILRLERRTVG